MSQIFKPEAATPPPPGFVEFLEGNDSVPVGPNAGDIIFVHTSIAAAGSTPFTTSGNAGTNTETWTIQTSQAIAGTDATKIGLAAFNSADFTVDANGFVSTAGNIATSYVTDSGTAVPSGGVLNVMGKSTIATTNGYVFSGSGNTVTLNETEGTGTTTGAQSVNLVVLNLGTTPGVYCFKARIAAFDTTDNTGAAFDVLAGARTTGAAATMIGATPVINSVLDAGLGTDQVTVIAVGNSVAFQGNGTVALKVIHWKASVLWTFAS